MRRAIPSDKPIIINILSESFKNDPYLHWLTRKSKLPDKLKYVIDYIVDETFNNGEIYLSNDNLATALWNSEKREKLSLKYIYRNLLFLIRFGVTATSNILRKDKFTHNQYPELNNYRHLYLIGVLPEGQGKGLASALLNPVLNNCSRESVPVLLETANPLNVEIYKKKGFSVSKTVQVDNITIFFMCKL